jgi:hypothetical protein
VTPLFAFVQFEFTHAIGPHAGRYVVAHPEAVDERGAALRSDELTTRESLTGVTMKPSTADVLVVGVVSAPAVRPRLRRRAREADADATDAPVALLLATFVRGAQPMPDRARADSLLDAVAGSEEEQERWVEDGLEVVNRAIRGYRAGARDPYVTEVAQRDARRVRIGYGSREEVADGRWHRALVLPPPVGARASREERIAPTELTADVLAGRRGVLETEDVLLRAYVDLDHGRLRAAAAQLRAAIDLLGAELGADGDPDLVDLGAQAAALGTDPEEAERLIASVEAIVDRHRAAQV